MYAVECYNQNGSRIEEPDLFDTYEEAYAFATEMAEHFLVDIDCPNGTVICIN